MACREEQEQESEHGDRDHQLDSHANAPRPAACSADQVNIQALGLPLRWVIAGYVSAAGAVLVSWLCVVSGMIAGCVRRAARAFRGSA